jgi:hypothetical protein
MERVDNVTLRDAVSKFAVAPTQKTYVDVMRECLHGDLLLDATGSDIQTSGDGITIQKGSTLTFREGAGQDGRRALLAFTSQDQVQKTHVDTPAVTIGQTASGVIEFAMKRGYAWLYIDPAGPTCGIDLGDFRDTMDAPRNEDVKSALAELDPSVQRASVIAALSRDGSLLQMVGQGPSGQAAVRTTTGPDGEPMAMAFTSVLEIAARYKAYSFASRSIEDVIREAITPPLAGLVINPGGPWIALSASELEQVPPEDVAPN